MKKIEQILSNYRNDLLSLHNVVGVGKGLKEVKGCQTDQECITVLVKSKLAKNHLSHNEIVPQNIEEEETDVIEVGEVELLNNQQLRVEKLRPAQPGISIGHYKITAGTFGAVVKDRETEEVLLLSNNHVLANISNGTDGRAYKGDLILQPGSYDGGIEENDVIAYLERFSPIYINERERSANKASVLARGFNDFLFAFANLLRAENYSSANNLVDCAVAKPKSQDLISDKIIGIGEIKGTDEAKLGMEVIKSGRTTGVTKSIVKAVDVTIRVRLSDSASTFFSNQILVDAFSKPGDSGSVVVNRDNEAVGLLFAGSEQSSILNRIDNVCDSLDIKF